MALVLKKRQELGLGKEEARFEPGFRCEDLGVLLEKINWMLVDRQGSRIQATGRRSLQRLCERVTLPAD